MGLKERVRGIFTRGKDPVAVYSNNSTFAGLFQSLTEPPRDIGPLGLVETENPALFRITQTISGDCAWPPLILVEKTGTNKHKIVEEHDAINVWRSPNEVDSSYVYAENLYADLLIYGNHYTHIKRVNGVPKRLTRLPAAHTKPLDDSKTIVTGYRWTAEDGSYNDYPVDEVIHFKTRNTQTPYMGMSPLERLRQMIVLERQMNKWNWNRFKNMIPTNLILQSEYEVAGGQDAMERLGQYIKQKMAGVEHAGEPLILTGNRWKVDTVTRPSDEELAFLDGLKFIRATYAMTYGCPPSQMSDWSDSFRSNSKEQSKDYYIGTVQAWHRLFLSFMNDIYLKRFFPFEPDLEFRYDYSKVAILAFSEQEKANINEILVRNAMLTPEEGRMNMGFDETGLEEMQQHYWNGKELGKEPEPLPMNPAQDPNAEESVKEPPPVKGPAADDKLKSITPKLQRALTEEEIYLLLSEDDLFDEDEEIAEGNKRFRGLLSLIAAGAAIQWLRLHNKPQVVPDNDFEIKEFGALSAERMSQSIVNTTVDRIRAIVAEANASGLPVRFVKQHLRELFEERKSDAELERIARTETHYASESGAFIAAKRDGSVAFKRWVTSKDEKVRGDQTGETRADHVNLDDVVVPLGSTFEDPKSHAHLRFPGDISGAKSGADVINCRCTWVAETEGETVDRDQFWYTRDRASEDYSQTLRSALYEFFDRMEKRVLRRLAEIARRKAV